MKKWKQITAGIMAVILAASCLAGCGKENEGKEGDKKTIEIACWNAGLGTVWLDELITAFEEDYPEYHVEYTATASATAVTAPFRNEGSDTVDIYMAVKEYDKEYMEPLDDVLDSTAEGESKTIREKINPSYLEMETASDGKVYSLTFGGGVLGIVYNKELFEQAGIRTLPRTTDELESVCDALASVDIVPFCHYKTSGYWNFMSEVFFAQYDGLDYYINSFYGCTDENGNSPSKDVFTKKDGRYAALKAYEKIITPDYVLAGSNSNDHVTMQTEFLSGKAAMMVNGAWLSHEMSSIGSVENFETMKTPVISTITDKLTTVKKEQELRKVITAIDAVTDGTADISEYRNGDGYTVNGLEVSAADWDYVRKARNSVAANFSGEGMFIPRYSDAKEGAKEFIKYIYSDKGYKIYTDALHVTLPITMDSGELDTSEWNSFEKNQLDLFLKAEQVVTDYIMSKHEIFSVGGASSFANYQYVNKFCSNNVADRQNAEEAWESMIAIVEKDYENSWLANMK